MAIPITGVIHFDSASKKTKYDAYVNKKIFIEVHILWYIHVLYVLHASFNLDTEWNAVMRVNVLDHKNYVLRTKIGETKMSCITDAPWRNWLNKKYCRLYISFIYEFFIANHIHLVSNGTAAEWEIRLTISPITITVNWTVKLCRKYPFGPVASWYFLV